MFKLKNGNNEVANVNNKNNVKNNENEVEREFMNDETPNLGDFNDLLHVMRYLEESIAAANVNNENNGKNN